jgi:Ser/Thr protein kinase RdoA (MazF antagonist)
MEGLVDALRTRYRVDVSAAEPVTVGYDVWAKSWRVDTDQGSLIVRADRGASLPTAAWIHDVVQRAVEAGVPCCTPLRTADGEVGFAMADAAITVRPFVEGARLDRNQLPQVTVAGTTLGLLHAALSGWQLDRPEPSRWDASFWSGEHDPPTLQDAELDAWNATFTASRGQDLARGVVHGDFWAGNLVWAAGGVAAVIDWAEARVDLLARELAWSTWEFGHREPSRQLDIERARAFLAGYRRVMGPWEPGLADVFIPLMRVELRRNARYSLRDPGDIEYNTAVQREFVRLRDQSAAALLEP